MHAHFRQQSINQTSITRALAMITVCCLTATARAGDPPVIACDEDDPTVFVPPTHDGMEEQAVAAVNSEATWDSTFVVDAPIALFDTQGGTRALVAIEFHFFFCHTVDITLHPNKERFPVGSQGNWEWQVDLSLPDDGDLILPFGNNLMPHGQIGGARGFGFGRPVGFSGEVFEDVTTSDMRPDLTTAPEYLQALSGSGTTMLRSTISISDIVYSDLDSPPFVFDPDFLEIVIDHVEVGIKAHFYYINVDPPTCPADIVTLATFQPPGDGQVDGADLAYLLGEWGANPGSLADIVTSATFQPPPDGVVNGVDLAVLLGAWGVCE
jgi:hypothetical protein